MPQVRVDRPRQKFIDTEYSSDAESTLCKNFRKASKDYETQFNYFSNPKDILSKERKKNVKILMLITNGDNANNNNYNGIKMSRS